MKKDLKFKVVVYLAILIFLFFVQRTIAEAVFRIEITNVVPVINYSTMECGEPVILTAASTTRLWCNVTASDINGWQDIYSVSAKFWYNNTANESDSDNYKNHYTQKECNLTMGSGNSVSVYCWFDVQFFADPGEWTFKFNVTDKGGACNTTNTTEITVVDFLAVSATGVINFGSMVPGDTSATSEIATVNNTCNQEIDVQVNSESDISCTTGTIPVDKIHYDTVYVGYEDMGGTLSTNVADTYDALNLYFNLQKSTTVSGTPVIPTKDTYWGISIPNGVSGTCNGTLSFTVKKS